MKSDIAFDVILGGMDRLPTLPGIAIRLLEAVQKEEPDLEEIGKIISTDPPLSAEVLKIINSPYYGLPKKITSVFHAINLLGIKAVKNLALSFSLVKKFKSKTSGGFDYTLFWKDSLIGAVAAKSVAEKVLPKFSEDAFFLGLLHNIGILTLIQCMPKQYSLVLKEIERSEYADHEAESQILGFDHMDVGEYLVKSWGLPTSFYSPIGCHHNPEKLVTDDADIETLIKILHLSALYIDLFNLPDSGLNLGLIEAWIKRHGFSNLISVDEIGLTIQNQTQQIFPLFEINLKGAKDYNQILESARKELIHHSTDFINKMLDQKREIEMLRKQVTRDGLTQLNNYQHFYELLHQEIYRAYRYNLSLSLIIADLDHFKSVNDTLGHLAGDYVIKSVANCLKKTLRESDHVARYGGEEFAIIMPETSLDNAIMGAERLRAEIQSAKFIYESKPIAITMSFGVASLPSAKTISREELINRADHALYKAKQNGRNRVHADGKKGWT